jgi:hypothetical protein
MMTKDTIIPSRYSNPIMSLLETITSDDVTPRDRKEDDCDNDED